MPSESKSKASSVASVEGQRTGAAECPKCHAKSDVEAQQKCAPGEDNCPMTCWEHWPLQAEFDAREAEQIKLADKQIAESSVPGVEGMGAREMWKDWPGPGKDIVLKLIEGGVSLEDADRMDRNIEAFAEAFHKQARSLRGAGGEQELRKSRDKLADILISIAVIVNAGIGPVPPFVQKLKDRALASESREQAMREDLKVSHNVLRTELGRKCDIQREDGLCEICREN